MSRSSKKASWRTVSFASGKGGVGKTLTTVNVASALIAEGKKTLIIDGDFGLSNVDVVLGLQARYNISDVIECSVSLEDIILDGPYGLRVIPSGTGITKLNNLSFAAKVGLLERITGLDESAEYILIDTGAGISDDVLHLNAISDDNVVVTTPEPHAITDAYAFIKVMSKKFGKKKFSLVVNMTRSKEEGLRVFNKVAEVSSTYLNVKLDLLGVVPLDPVVASDVLCRRSINDGTFGTVAGQAWKRCAESLMAAGTEEQDCRNIHFWKDLVLQPGIKRVGSIA